MCSRAPLALLNVKFGQRVDVQVSRRMDEDYQPPPPQPRKYFEGDGGNRLGSSMVAARSPEPVQTAVKTPESNSLVVDQSKPKTKVRVQLSNGEK